MKKARRLYEKIRNRLEEIKATNLDKIIWGGKRPSLEEFEEDSPFVNGLIERKFINYIGADLVLPEVIIGELIDKTRRYECGSINPTHSLCIQELSPEYLKIYRTPWRNPLRAFSNRGEDGLVVGINHDIFSPILEYAENNIEWEYEPESMAYCDGNKLTRENNKRIIKTLEYILAN